MPRKNASIKALFLDIGGVLLTNGWGRESRKLAAKTFKLDYDEMNDLHKLTFDTYEEGKMSLDEYLNFTVFNMKRNFTRAEFKKFMFAQSQPFPEMLDLITEIKDRNRIKIAAVSNEGKELNEYRIKKFKLNSIFDFYVSSSIVHLRKPDKEIYEMALGLVGYPPEEIIYIEDRELYVKIGNSIGINSIRHINYHNTKKKLNFFGLQ